MTTGRVSAVNTRGLLKGWESGWICLMRNLAIMKKMVGSAVGNALSEKISLAALCQIVCSLGRH